MNWDRLFDDLEGQLAAEWEAERAVRDAESERLRISRLSMSDRLRALSAGEAPLVCDLADGRRVSGVVRTVGADWLAIEEPRAAPSLPGCVHLLPLHSVHGVGSDHGAILHSLDDVPSSTASLHGRATFGFVLRDLARRRVPVHLSTRVSGEIHGTIDRAGADHLDIAVHDAGAPRTTRAVRDFRVVPFAAVVGVRVVANQIR